MKKVNFIIVLSLLLSNIVIAQTWEILDKSMSAWNVDEGQSFNRAWATVKGGTITMTQNEGYVNLAKSGNWAWFRPAVSIGSLTSGTAYSVEVKVRVNSGDQSQFSLRINGGGETFYAPVFLKYGDELTGSVSTVAGGTSNAFPLNTSEWHVYRLVLRANHTEYDVYLDDIKEPVLVNGKIANKSDQSGVYFGAESGQSCNMDIEYVKMGTGDVMASFNPLLTSLSVSAGTLIPAFNPKITEYKCELYTTDPNTITPSATAASELAQVLGLGTVDVSSGTAISTIQVTAGDGITKKIYTINYVQTGNTDYTSLIVNNDFDYAAENILWNDNTNPNYPKFSDGTTTFVSNCFRPVKTNITTIDTHAEFYGWQMSDWSFMFTNSNGTTPTQSIGIGSGNDTFHGSSAPWIAGNSTMVFPNNFEFYQTVDKNSISEGTYKVTCRMGIQNGHLTSQRLFANQNVQFFGKETDYATNKTEGEIYSYAGYTPSGENVGKELKVYVTVTEDESIKLGLRGGSYKGDGTLASTGNIPGWFKFDYFTLTKINPTVASNADLASLSLSSGTLSFNPTTQTYNVSLPNETQQVTPIAVAAVEDAKIEGIETVDVSGGSGTSIIKITALDGITTKTYTVNYSKVITSVQEVTSKVSYSVINQKLSVLDVEAYSVYSINGMKVAEIKVNPEGTAVELLSGVYVVKTKNAGAFKVVIK